MKSTKFARANVVLPTPLAPARITRSGDITSTWNAVAWVLPASVEQQHGGHRDRWRISSYRPIQKLVVRERELPSRRGLRLAEFLRPSHQMSELRAPSP